MTRIDSTNSTLMLEIARAMRSASAALLPELEVLTGIRSVDLRPVLGEMERLGFVKLRNFESGDNAAEIVATSKLYHGP